MTSGNGDFPFPESTPRYSGFSEDAAVEEPAVALFQALGWNHANLYKETFGTTGTEGRTTMRETLLPNRLWGALQKLNPHLSTDALRDAAAEITRDRSAMLPTDANAEIYRLLRMACRCRCAATDGERKTEIARVIDWRDPRANDFCSLSRSGSRATCTSAAPTSSASSTASRSCSSSSRDRPRTSRTPTTTTSATTATHPAALRLQRLRHPLERLETKVGATFAPWEHFGEWKRIDERGRAAGASASRRRSAASAHPERLLDLVENFVAYREAAGRARQDRSRKNHQFLGVNARSSAVDRIARDAREAARRVLAHAGLRQEPLDAVVHAEGAAPHARRLDVRDGHRPQRARRPAPRRRSPTPARSPTSAKTCTRRPREHLRELLRGDHRYVFTLIHKFRHERRARRMPVLSDRDDVIVITDEAHRSQYDMLALNMRRRLPNAAFIGFTGTPLIAGEETTARCSATTSRIYNFRDVDRGRRDRPALLREPHPRAAARQRGLRRRARARCSRRPSSTTRPRGAARAAVRAAVPR